MPTSTRGSDDARDAGPVVVCCAAAEAQALAEALGELEAEGYAVEIVPGVEADPKALEPVIERREGEGLYVLCRSRQLGRDTIEQLREILLAHHVPFGRTLTVATRQPRDLVDRVRSAGSRSPSRRRATSAPPKRLVTKTPVPLPSRPAGAKPPPVPARDPAPGPGTPLRDFFDDDTSGVRTAADAEASGPDDEAAREALAALDPPTIELPESRSRLIPDDSAAISLTDAAVELEGPDPGDNSLANASLDGLDFSDLDAEGSFPDALRRRAATVPVRTGDTTVGEAPRPEPALPPPPPIAPRVPARPSAAPVAAPAASLAAAVPSAGPPAAPSFVSAPAPPPPPAAGPAFDAAASSSVHPAYGTSSSRNNVLWGAGLVGVGLVSLIVVCAVRGDGDEARPSPTATRDAKSPSEAPVKTSDAAAAPDAADAAPPTEVDGPVVVEDAPGKSRELLALAERRVRALDVLLVQPESAGPMTHGDAVAYCEELDIDGLDGWRLPEVGELSSLTAAGMVGPATYWTATAGDTFGDTHLQWHGRRQRILQARGESRVLCVSGEPAAP